MNTKKESGAVNVWPKRKHFEIARIPATVNTKTETMLQTTNRNMA